MTCKCNGCICHWGAVLAYGLKWKGIFLNERFILFSLKLSSDAVHGHRPGEVDEATEAVRRKDSVFSLSNA